MEKIILTVTTEALHILQAAFLSKKVIYFIYLFLHTAVKTKASHQ